MRIDVFIREKYLARQLTRGAGGKNEYDHGPSNCQDIKTLITNLDGKYRHTLLSITNKKQEPDVHKGIILGYISFIVDPLVLTNVFPRFHQKID